jgi:hypothetical protein
MMFFGRQQIALRRAALIYVMTHMERHVGQKVNHRTPMFAYANEAWKEFEHLIGGSLDTVVTIFEKPDSPGDFVIGYSGDLTDERTLRMGA